MLATLTITRYRKRYVPFALLAMAFFHLPLRRNKKLRFYKLLGSGRSGSFDIHPDWQQWGILVVRSGNTAGYDTADHLRYLYGPFIAGWLSLFRAETCTFFLSPVEGHGRWDNRQPFGELPRQADYNGPVAVLTRATIRLSKLPVFWKNAKAVGKELNNTPGLIASFGIGEIPLVKQATFSIWQDKESMKAFAYQVKTHSGVVKRTRHENWYQEELFVRFIPVKTIGTIRGTNPLEGII